MVRFLAVFKAGRAPVNDCVFTGVFTGRYDESPDMFERKFLVICSR